MSNKALNKEIFIQHLSEITRGMKQKEIASIMGCTEGTMSKYLNPDKKDFPPVDRLYNLSLHFKVSLDWLVGVQTERQHGSRLSAKDICLKIIEIYNALPFDFEIISKAEDCYISDAPYAGGSYKNQNNQYLSIYFSNWDKIKEYDPFMIDLGNDRPKAIEINNFLTRFQKIKLMLSEGNLDNEMYNIILDKYLSEVSDQQ